MLKKAPDSSGELKKATERLRKVLGSSIGPTWMLVRSLCRG